MIHSRIKNKQKRTPIQSPPVQIRNTEYDIKLKEEDRGDNLLNLPVDYTPNASYIMDIKKTVDVHEQCETEYREQMTENSFDDYNSYSDYKRKMIHEMAKSVVDESNNLFGNIHNNETRKYEEQYEFQVSEARNMRNKQIAKNITSRYMQK